MPMTNNGLSKLTEEIGELGQVVGKMLQYPELQKDWIKSHPDEKGPLLPRLEEEAGDVLGAIWFVAAKLGLSMETIEARAEMKEALFHQWDRGEDKVPK